MLLTTGLLLVPFLLPYKRVYKQIPPYSFAKTYECLLKATTVINPLFILVIQPACNVSVQTMDKMILKR